MNDKRHDQVEPSTGGTDRAGIPNEPASSASHVASRRYMLLKGIGRGSAILAAAVPIKTLASNPSVTDNGQICTISGVQSGAHSQATNLPKCAGLDPAKYATVSNWPSYTVNGKSLGNSTKFNDVFGGTNNSRLESILDWPKTPDSAERHWVTAWFNAIKPPPSYVFPYSPDEVVALYKSVQQSAALDFFKGWMETIAS